ncbi:hypothetical protein TNCV_1348871 [Trichonephila clavipes]|nr:hypothetical protein TNCV_1348871 [Trichonephila clavipes]
MCPGDHRRRVWRHPGQCTGPAFTNYTPHRPQPGVMVWSAVSFDIRTPLVVIRGTLAAQHRSLEQLSSLKPKLKVKKTLINSRYPLRMEFTEIDYWGNGGLLDRMDKVKFPFLNY